MSWSADFIAGIESRDVPIRWAIRTIQVLSEATFGGTYMAAVDPRDGDPILCGPPSCTGARLSMDSWTSTLAAWSFEMTGDLTQLRANVTRGTCVEILLFAGGAVERVSFGRVQSVTTSGRGVTTLTIGDPTTLLDGRSVADGSKVALFYGLLPDNIADTTLTADYTAGDPTITVASTTGFTYQAGERGCLLCGTTLLTYDPTLTTSTEFTVSTTGEFSTTAADAATGDAVTEVALIEGHPIAMALRVLTSTGAGTNGSYDDLPVGWGFGIPATLIAVDDAEMEIAEVVHLESAGTYTLSLIVTEAQVDPRSWVQGWLSAVGCFMALYQGKLTVRGVTLHETRHRNTVATITDADLDPSVGVSSEWWDSGKSVEAAQSPVYSASVQVLDAAEDLETLPGVYIDPIDLSAVLYDYTYEGEVMTEVYNRTYRSRKRVPELVTLPVAGLGAMGICPGDWVVYQSERTDFRYSYAGLGRILIVTQVSPDPRNGRVTLRGVSYGPDGEVFA